MLAPASPLVAKAEPPLLPFPASSSARRAPPAVCPCESFRFFTPTAAECPAPLPRPPLLLLLLLEPVGRVDADAALPPPPRPFTTPLTTVAGKPRPALSVRCPPRLLQRQCFFSHWWQVAHSFRWQLHAGSLACVLPLVFPLPLLADEDALLLPPLLPVAVAVAVAVVPASALLHQPAWLKAFGGRGQASSAHGR